MPVDKYTPEEDAILLRMRADGIEVQAIATQLGRTYTSVVNRYRAIKNGRRYKSPWTAENDARLRVLVSTGSAYKDVAKAMGISRNAVIGRCHRLGISAAPENVAKAANFLKPRGVKLNDNDRIDRLQKIREAAASGLSKTQTARMLGLSDRLISTLSAQHGLDWDGLDGRRSMTIHQPPTYELQAYRPLFVPPARTCQYIKGKVGRSTLFCADTSKPGYSYCTAHHAVCYDGFARPLGKIPA
jgi:hypothetical protein